MNKSIQRTLGLSLYGLTMYASGIMWSWEIETIHSLTFLSIYAAVAVCFCISMIIDSIGFRKKIKRDLHEIALNYKTESLRILKEYDKAFPIPDNQTQLTDEQETTKSARPEQ